MLHRRMDGEPPPTLSNAEKTPPNHNMRQGTVEGSAGVERGRVRSGRGDDGGLGDLDPTISRLVRKLANKGWVRFYDSLKATFTLQAEGIARQVVFDADAIADNAAAAALGVDEAPREAAVIGIGLERLRLCIAAWEAYKDWCEEVSGAKKRLTFPQINTPLYLSCYLSAVRLTEHSSSSIVRQTSVGLLYESRVRYAVFFIAARCERQCCRAASSIIVVGMSSSETEKTEALCR